MGDRHREEDRLKQLTGRKLPAGGFFPFLEVAMTDYFIWNGVDCRTKGIHVSELPPITIPLERSKQTNVPGRPGSHTAGG